LTFDKTPTHYPSYEITIVHLGLEGRWDWKEDAPIAKIVDAVRETKNAKARSFDSGGDDFGLIVAATKAEALKCWLKGNKEFVDEMVKEGGGKAENYYPEITPWED
jgi:hypothetical protein